MASVETSLDSTVARSQLALEGLEEPLQVFTLGNRRGTQVQLADLGASLLSVHTADRNGRRGNILLTYGDPSHWLDNSWFLGVTVGRVANRIGRARFPLGEGEVQLPVNDGENHLHGGPQGLGTRRWSASPGPGAAVTFRCESADGDGGYPGRVEAELTYRLSEEDELTLEYRARSDCRTPISLTNHAYWNLAAGGSILDHELQINAAQYLELDSGLVPTGQLLNVDSTALDFRRPKPIGRDIDRQPGGYDNYWVVERTGDKALKSIASLWDPLSGRRLEVISSEPGVQFYSGNFLDGTRNREDGSPMAHRSGLCLETHGFPDAPNHSEFPSVMLEAGEEYRQTTIYRFSAK
ncbi:aldose epimerase family protein [Microbulbifer sp. TB1203]|uniref:aldose epimerase family protein n=1 Tax=Microbulbifer sp. TB1203 TaxID=3021712 RepID=UPI0027E4416E|nr:aldose epimerase family protein [Microbulbifer sp. TB1203]